MTTVGRWSPNKVRARVLDGTWVSPEELGGMVLLTPTSIAYTGTSASIGTNGSIEFSACTSLSLNGVFSADYDNYKIVIRHSTIGNAEVGGRLRLSGVDADAANYTTQYLMATSTSVSGLRESSRTYLRAGISSNEQRSGDVLYLFGPYLAQPTATRHVSAWGRDNARTLDGASTHSLSTSYDGITFLPDSAFTGLVSVYGLVGA